MKIHAMIAEDERLAREELAYLLQQEEDIVLCPSAETGEQLLQLLEQYRPDVIFLDIQMPALSGVEAAKKMRQKRAVRRRRFLLLCLQRRLMTMRWRRLNWRQWITF